MTTEKAWKGVAMEGPVARWYTKITRGNRGYAALADRVAATLPPGASALEVAAGPGYLAVELARRGLRVTASDISETFVAIAKETAASAGVAVDVHQANAAALPFADGSFDFAVCRAAFKNFTDPVGAMNELYRVLRPGGEAWIADLRHEADPGAIREEIAAMGLSWPNAVWTGLTFRWFLLKNAYTEDGIRALAAQSRFGRGEYVRDGVGFELRLRR